MTSVRRQTSISCAPVQVDEVLADIERLAEFLHMTVVVSLLEEGLVGDVNALCERMAAP